MSAASAPRVAVVAGLVIGLASGLLYTWVIDPVELVSTYPGLLRADFRQDWVHLAALSYVADGNLERAHTRLEGLDQEDVAQAMQTLIEGYAAAGRSADTLRRMTTLAEALHVHTPAMLVYLYTATSPPTGPGIRTHTPAPTPTHTPPSPPPATPAIPTQEPVPTPKPSNALPTLPSSSEPFGTSPTPTPTPPLPHHLQLAEQEQICQPGLTPHVEVSVRDERGGGLPGVVVWLVSPDEANRAVTGLKPQHGAGYADFNAEPNVSYALSVGELGAVLINDLRIETCPGQRHGEPLLGSWRIVLAPPSPEPEESGSD